MEKKAAIVIASAGGFPKDRNMYQAQKALDNAAHAVRDGGIIIWIAECSEGLGEKHFEDWMTGHEKASDMIEHIKRDFVLGGHKAAAIAMVLERARIMLVSGLDADFVRSLFLEPQESLGSALTEAFDALGQDASVLLMPYAGSTLPTFDE
jgi:nickel-dependent lactate racemase